ncbi:MAG: GGDEF domain-containing protein [Alteromonadaceae bacterium]|nr:MAG: GGDEF domain-containing protein [Alteromonadaceae bacterium]
MFPNKRIEEFYRLYERLLNFSDLSWWIIDLEDDPNIFYCNNTMCKIFSLDASVIHHSVSETCPIAGDYNTNVAMQSLVKAKQIFNEYHQLRRGEIEEYSNSFPYFNSKSEETLYFSSRARALVKDQSGNAILLFGIIEPETISNELYKRAKTDSLTGINNRREFDFQLEFLINLALRKKTPLSLIICDIDHFKQYNDKLGHYAGDECLIQVARSISNTCVRSTDIPCRYGGEEFSIIVYGDEMSAFNLAEAIRAEVYNMAIPHPAKDNYPVTLSVGFCTLIPDSETKPKRLIEQADAALFKAKHNGRNNCVRFQEEVVSK